MTPFGEPLSDFEQMVLSDALKRDPYEWPNLSDERYFQLIKEFWAERLD